MQSTLEPSSDANLPRATRSSWLLPYDKVTIADPYQRHIVYGVSRRRGLGLVRRGESGPAGGMADLDAAKEIKERMDVPNFVSGGPQNPMGARAIYLYAGNKYTLYRIHGTNQPEYIGQAISSGCIRLTNQRPLQAREAGHRRRRARAAPVRLADQPAANENVFN
jgi:hypothetical protein